MMTCSELGLEPDGRRAHLIPFGDTCTLIIDYKGIVELAMNSGTVSSIFSQIVCENDEFTYKTGEIEHNINFRQPRGKMYAVYCIIKFKDGGQHTEVMTLEDVNRIRARSKAANKGPWVTDFDEMAKKTVFRRGSKWVKLSPEVQDALDREDDFTEKPLIAEVTTNLAQLPEESGPEPAEPAAIDIPVSHKIETAAVEHSETSKSATEPSEQAEIPPPQPKPAQPSVQGALEAFVLSQGYTFEHLKAWGEDTGNLPDADSIPSFTEVPDDVCRRLLRAQQGLLRGLAAVKAAEKGTE
jgi:recombination protein RecT